MLQQLAGINTVMYFAPTLLQAAGIHNPRTALLASLIPAATNAAGTAVGLVTIERSGRRRLFLASLAAVVAVLCALGGAFRAAETHSPPVVANTAALNAIHTAGATSCAVSRQGTCIECLKVGCGFCSGAASQPGVCLTAPALQFGALDQQCSAIHLPPSVTGTSIGAAHGVLYLSGCPSPYTGLTLFLLVMYLAAFSPGVGPVPWAVNSEIYPLEVRGLATGEAIITNYVQKSDLSDAFDSIQAQQSAKLLAQPRLHNQFSVD